VTHYADTRVSRPVQISLLLLYCCIYMLHWLLSTRSLHLGSHTTVFDIIQGVSFIETMSTAAAIRCPCRWGLPVRYGCHAQRHDKYKTEHMCICGLCRPRGSAKFRILKLLASFNTETWHLWDGQRICIDLFIF
jgi:hypothetical protein